MRVFYAVYLPPLLVFLVNSIILPYLISVVASYERHHTRSAETRSVFQKNALFLSITVIFMPTLALNSIEAFLQATYNSSLNEWHTMIGSTLFSSSGQFFIQYMIHAAFLGGGARLLDLGRAIYRWWVLRSAVTQKEKNEAVKVIKY